MEAIVRRCAVAALSAGLVAPIAAAERTAYSFDACIAKRECRLVSRSELGRLRGGFTITTMGGTVELTFGIAQAIFVNDQLVAVTQIVSDLGQTIARLAPAGVSAEVLTAALQNASAAVASSTRAAAGGAQAAAAAASQSAQAGQPSAQAGAGVGTQAAQASQPAVQAVSNAVTNAVQGVQTAAQAAASAGSGAAGAAGQATQQATQAASKAGSAVPVVVVNGTPVTPGNAVLKLPSAAELRSLVIQNGIGNSAPVISNAAAATVIQNTVDGAAIRAMTVMEVSAKVKDALSGLRLHESIRQSIR